MKLSKFKVRRNSLLGGVADDLSNGVQSIIRQSTKAVCGTLEREVTVPAERVAVTKAKLRASGMMIVGTSEPVGRTRKIWFVPRGAAGL
jgi:hypothetical protein